MSRFFDYLRANQAAMLAHVEELVKKESPSNNKRLVDECGKHVAKLFHDELRIDPQIIVQEDHGNHLLAQIGSGPTKVLVLGHYDTVWDPGILHYHVEGNRAFGPGIFDMKAGIVQGIWAMKAIQFCEEKSATEVTFLLTSDEEIGSPTSRPLIETITKQSDAVLVLEPSVGKTGELKTQRKGTAFYSIDAQGIAAHAGNHPEDGASAINEMCLQATRLMDFHNNVPGTTINIGTFRGGTRTNVVAEHAAIDVDVRFSEPSESERLTKAFNAIASFDERVKIVVSGGVNRPPMNRTPESTRLYELARTIAKRELGFELGEASVGGGSDGNFTAGLGIPTLDGLGAVGDGPHAEHEHVQIDTLPQRAALLAELLVNIF